MNNKEFTSELDLNNEFTLDFSKNENINTTLRSDLNKDFHLSYIGEKVEEVKPKKIRYNENAAMKEHLMSEKGLKFLVEASKNKNVSDVSILEKIDALIDFYVTWANNFPVKKNIKMTKYEFLKRIENFIKETDFTQN
ncbi:hypothetical protein HERIO_607 [Hepatospora eriocheir]|uniref:Uncharacterized protein n=1 Tax=Hepatospora eriocheir TaxID=1081669 RepID=A0A1X0QCY3_9MICR|nr:hypothetical protein HERIO_607 [Hepatospora eriocheir]